MRVNDHAFRGVRTAAPKPPDLFANPPGAGSVILDEFPPEGGPYGICYRDQYLTLLRDPVAFPDGRTGGYLRALHSGGHAGAAVLPVHDGRIVLLRHFRHATRQWHWEIPRGFPEPGEPAEKTARRELEEEIGVPAESVEFLGDVYADTGVAGSKVGLFWAAVGGRTSRSAGRASTISSWSRDNGSISCSGKAR